MLQSTGYIYQFALFKRYPATLRKLSQLYILLAAIIVASFAGCGGGGGTSPLVTISVQPVPVTVHETQSLLNNDTDTLLSLSETKTQTANQLMELGKKRRAAVLGNSKDSMETWLAKHAPTLQKQWGEIRKLAAQSQQLNTTNGELIHSRMRNNQQSLNVLYTSTKSPAGLYGREGQANINSAGRHLGSV